MERPDDLQKRIEKLEARNRRVEADKAWETSWQRRAIIVTLTYIIVVFYLALVVHINPWVNALVPVIGFFLSTLTVSLFKQWWMSEAEKSHKTSGYTRLFRTNQRR